MKLIEVKNLTKQYAGHTAVDDISFTVEDGKIYGFLGPNGAGKSTTMNIITGCLSATSGTVTVNGFDIFKKPIDAKRCIGYLPEMPPLYVDMTPREYLTFVARAKGIKKQELKAGIEDVIEKTDLGTYADKLIKHLSKGYKQRVGIAQAILGNPDFIILDEPTVGLDPAQIIEIRNLIKSLGEQHTVILSSHILSEISEVCDEIIVISNGRIVACDTKDNLLERSNPSHIIEVEIQSGIDAAAEAVAEIEAVAAIEIDAPEGSESGTLKITVDGADDIRGTVSSAVVGAGAVMLSIDVKSASLEDIFISLTENAPEASDESNSEGENSTEDAPEDEDGTSEEDAGEEEKEEEADEE